MDKVNDIDQDKDKYSDSISYSESFSPASIEKRHKDVSPTKNIEMVKKLNAGVKEKNLKGK